MISLGFIADALDGDENVDINDVDRFDLNRDGIITAKDCPFQDGSPEAKLWFKNILQPFAKAAGAYNGKPLMSAEEGPGQGDFQFLVDKIRVTQGLSYQSAVKIAGKIKAFNYGA